MNKQESQFDSDDELLSAYVDDELTAAERAVVESRLAADPAAQHLVEQLRAVSQSVQALPFDTSPGDLSERIMRRVEQTNLASRTAAAASPMASSDTEPAPMGGVIPNVTVFRAPRSWFWASLAVAASLLIMVLQTGDKPNKPLPAIAQRDAGTVANQPADETAQRTLDMPSPASPAELPAAAPPPATIALDDRALKVNAPLPSAPPALQPEGQLSKETMAGAKAESAIAASRPAPEKSSIDESTNGTAEVATSTASQPAADKLTENSLPASSASGGAMRGALATRSESDLEGEQTRPVVVHVVAKRKALENKTFERLLTENGITMETPAPSQELSDRYSRLGSQAEPARADGVAAAKPAGGEPTVDMVLVEAPRPAIFKCMDGLNQDASNFPGLAVDEPPAKREDAKSLPNRKPESDLGRYSRGYISQQQKDAFRNTSSLYDFDASGERSKSKLAFDGAYAATEEAKSQAAAQQIEKLERGLESKEGRGRARRIQVSVAEIRQHGTEAGKATGPVLEELLKMNRSRQASKTPADAENDSLQVLFVLSPDQEPATGTPAEKAAQ